MDFERNDGDAARRRREAERGLPTEPPIEGDPYVRDDTPTP
jgi:hypothetical protein